MSTSQPEAQPEQGKKQPWQRPRWRAVPAADAALGVGINAEGEVLGHS
jgi:hypothetical protein